MNNIAIGANRAFSLLIARVVQAQPGEKYSRSDYDSFTAEFVLEGAGWLEIDGRYYDVEAGDMYILPPGKTHEYAADSEHPWCKIFFNAGGTLPARLLDGYCLEACHFPGWRQPQIFDDMLSLYDRLSDEAHLEAALLFHRLIALAAQECAVGQAQGHRAVALARQFIGNNLQNPVSLDDIAAAAFLSPSQITRLFKAETGCTPYDFLCRQRIEMAKHLLRSTDLRIAEIAQRLQYADAFYFSNAFKRATGASPRRFRSPG